MFSIYLNLVTGTSRIYSGLCETFMMNFFCKFSYKVSKNCYGQLNLTVTPKMYQNSCSKMYIEPSHTFIREGFCENVNSFKPLTFSQKCSIIKFWEGSLTNYFDAFSEWWVICYKVFSTLMRKWFPKYWEFLQKSMARASWEQRKKLPREKSTFRN